MNRSRVVVRRVVIRSAGEVRDIPLDHPALTGGWTALEWANGRMTRCFSGFAPLPVPAMTVPAIVEVLV